MKDRKSKYLRGLEFSIFAWKMTKMINQLSEIMAVSSLGKNWLYELIFFLSFFLWLHKFFVVMTE